MDPNNKELAIPRQVSEYKAQETARWQAFGAWVRERRRNIGLSQGAAASRAGISGNHWSRIENGKSGIRYDKVEAIACALELAPSLVFEHSGYLPPDSGKRYFVAKRTSQTLQKPVITEANRLSDSSQSIAVIGDDIRRLEGHIVKILDSQRRQTALAKTTISALRRLFSKMEDRQTGIILKRLLIRAKNAGMYFKTSIMSGSSSQ